jgi:hypothetical protein
MSLSTIKRKLSTASISRRTLPEAQIDMWFSEGHYVGASLHNLNVSRASSAYMEDGQGRWVEFRPNTPRVTRKGLLVEDSCTNVVLWCRDLTNSIWSPNNISVSKDQTGFDGKTDAASTITATDHNGTVLQSIPDSSSIRRHQSAFVKRIRGSGPVEMTMDGGATWALIEVKDAWTRASIPPQTIAEPRVGFRIGTPGDAIGVDCVQNEKVTSGIYGAYLNSSPIVSAGAMAVRDADIIKLLPIPMFSPSSFSMYCEGVFAGQDPGPNITYPYLFNVIGADPNSDVFGFGSRSDNVTWPSFGAVIGGKISGPKPPVGNPIAGNPFAIAAAFSAARSQVAVNGNLGTESPVGSSTNPIKALGFGLSAHYQPPPFFYFRRVGLWPKQILPDRKLKEITAKLV